MYTHMYMYLFSFLSPNVLSLSLSLSFFSFFSLSFSLYPLQPVASIGGTVKVQSWESMLHDVYMGPPTRTKVSLSIIINIQLSPVIWLHYSAVCNICFTELLLFYALDISVISFDLPLYLYCISLILLFLLHVHVTYTSICMHEFDFLS